MGAFIWLHEQWSIGAHRAISSLPLNHRRTLTSNILVESSSTLCCYMEWNLWRIMQPALEQKVSQTIVLIDQNRIKYSHWISFSSTQVNSMRSMEMLNNAFSFDRNSYLYLSEDGSIRKLTMQQYMYIRIQAIFMLVHRFMCANSLDIRNSSTMRLKFSYVKYNGRN